MSRSNSDMVRRLDALLVLPWASATGGLSPLTEMSLSEVFLSLSMTPARQVPRGSSTERFGFRCALVFPIVRMFVVQLWNAKAQMICILNLTDIQPQARRRLTASRCFSIQCSLHLAINCLHDWPDVCASRSIEKHRVI